MDSERQVERRQHPRTKIPWPVVVEGKGQVFHAQALNVGRRGAKVTATEPLAPGTPAWLHFHPPGEQPLDLSAVVWRVDPDGLAFFFLEDLAVDPERVMASGS
jgi:hypothetical protein